MTARLQTLIAFIFFFCAALLAYCSTAGTGFVTDEIGWFETYNSYGWKGLLDAFGDKSLHFVYHLFGFTLWRLFKFNGSGWMLVFVILHAAVATAAFHLFRSIFSKIQAVKAGLISFTGAVLFLLSPYQTEVLVWYACVHYLVCTLLVLLALQFFINFLEKGNGKSIVAFYVLFIVAVFTLEISFCVPFILAAFIVLFPLQHYAVQNKIKLCLLFVLPSFAAVAGYFLLSKFLRGNFAGHYGADTHFNFSIPLLTANLFSYSAKVFALAQFWPHEKREALYNIFQNKAQIFAAVSALALVCLACRYRKLPVAFKAALFLLASFALALSPVLNLFFYFITNVEGDRFTYLASVFGAQLIAFSLITFLSYAGWIAAFVFIFFQLKFLSVNTESWKNNCVVRQSLLEKFEHQNASHIFILNLPDNYRGTYMFRTFLPDNSFAETYKLMYGRGFESRTTQVLSYNMNSIDDSVVVEKISDNELKVTLAQWGNWWWAGGKGAVSYSTNNYSVAIDEWNHSYTIHFKAKIPGAVYLYQCGREWRKVEGF